jgi:hypothetical protein
LSIVTAPDNATAALLYTVLPTNTFAIARSLLEFNAVSTYFLVAASCANVGSKTPVS